MALTPRVEEYTQSMSFKYEPASEALHISPLSTAKSSFYRSLLLLTPPSKNDALTERKRALSRAVITITVRERRGGCLRRVRREHHPQPSTYLVWVLGLRRESLLKL